MTRYGRTWRRGRVISIRKIKRKSSIAVYSPRRPIFKFSLKVCNFPHMMSFNRLTGVGGLAPVQVAGWVVLTCKIRRGMSPNSHVARNHATLICKITRLMKSHA